MLKQLLLITMKRQKKVLNESQAICSYFVRDSTSIL